MVITARSVKPVSKALQIYHGLWLAGGEPVGRVPAERGL